MKQGSNANWFFFYAVRFDPTVGGQVCINHVRPNQTDERLQS